MTDFPTTVFIPRTTENLPGIVYDPDNKQNMYSEDFQNLGAEITAIEKVLQIPDGVLFGGKIMPSVSGNNLTLALKTNAGNNPSVSNPVYIRISGVIYAITSALSVTKNAGTNWFNAGSAELATKEIDYFAYLGYNATDGVVLGFSRIPYANLYSDFSTTTTNEKYCAISTITNAAAGDNYVNIGRFASTLSATASFNWSVPTFTSSNLIQRPIYETRWLTWQPVYSATGSMTYTAVTTVKTMYRIVMRTIYNEISAVGTTGGTTNIGINVSLPFTEAATGDQRLIVYIFDVSVGNRAGWSVLNNQNSIQFLRADTGNWGLGTGREVGATFFSDI